MNAHVVLQLHYALQLLVTLVTEKHFIQMLMHMHCLPGHHLTYLLLALHILQCWLNFSIQASEGLATVLTSVYRHVVAVLGLLLIHVARGGGGFGTQWAAEEGSRSSEKGRCRLSGPHLLVARTGARCQEVDKSQWF